MGSSCWYLYGEPKFSLQKPNEMMDKEKQKENYDLEEEAIEKGNMNKDRSRR